MSRGERCGGGGEGGGGGAERTLRLFLDKHVRPAPLKNHPNWVVPKLKNSYPFLSGRLKITLSGTILCMMFVKNIHFFRILPI